MDSNASLPTQGLINGETLPDAPLRAGPTAAANAPCELAPARPPLDDGRRGRSAPAAAAAARHNALPRAPAQARRPARACASAQDQPWWVPNGGSWQPCYIQPWLPPAPRGLAGLPAAASAGPQRPLAGPPRRAEAAAAATGSMACRPSPRQCRIRASRCWARHEPCSGAAGDPGRRGHAACGRCGRGLPSPGG